VLQAAQSATAHAPKFAPQFAMTMTEIESAKQYHGRISVFGAIGASLLVVAATALFRTGAYKLLRRATDKP
jgi:hypothetical protein